jgi:hypothetical protein
MIPKIYQQREKDIREFSNDVSRRVIQAHIESCGTLTGEDTVADGDTASNFGG